VDNGISSLTGVRAARAQGVKVLITDHHLPGPKLPDANAVVNPNQVGCEFPSKCIAGVGVMFYVLLALRAKLRERGWFESQSLTELNLAEFLDLVALGTVADVVALDQNNRRLVSQGLARIRAGRCRPGISALLRVAGRDREQVVASDMGFSVAPRLNAAGRLTDMARGVECLLSDDASTALAMAGELDKLNQQRRSIEADMQEQAVASLSKLELDDALAVGLCLFDESWHQGVVGILASRIKERVHRPVIAFALEDEHTLKGSGRSIAGFHIRDALQDVSRAHPSLMTQFGGHAMAAGLTLPRENFDAFCAAFDHEAKRHLDKSTLEGVINTDGALQPEDMSLNVAEVLRNAGPWGQGFPEPVFDGEFSVVQSRILKDRHIKLVLGLPSSRRTVEAIQFNGDVDAWHIGVARVRIAYRLDVNEFRGVRSVNFIVSHLEATQIKE
jgi:single-stranded-DNA-specific exonuclease